MAMGASCMAKASRSLSMTAGGGGLARLDETEDRASARLLLAEACDTLTMDRTLAREADASLLLAEIAELYDAFALEADAFDATYSALETLTE